MKKELFDSINKELLRECTLESLKVGDLIIWCKDGQLAEYLGPITNGVDYSGENDIAIRWVEEDNTGIKAGSVCFNKSHRFYHLPLAWFDGNPLYEGDIVYGVHNNEPYTINEYLESAKVAEGMVLTPQDTKTHSCLIYDVKPNSCIDDFSVGFSIKPKTKERWIAVINNRSIPMGTVRESKEALIEYLSKHYSGVTIGAFEFIKLPDTEK